MALFGRHQATNMNIFAAPGNTERVVYRDSGSSNYFAEALAFKEEVKQVTTQRDQFIEAYEEAESVGLERRAINAGLRAVLREALSVLRAEQPNHPLLDKRVRQKMFEQYERGEFNGFIELRKRDGEKTDHLIKNFPQRPNEHLMEDI